MKTLLFVFLAGTTSLFADDRSLLQNGDFAGGIAHWHGECHSPDSASVDLSSKPTGGVVVQLQPGSWTKISQDFDGQVGEFDLSITYTLLPGTVFSDKDSDYQNIPGQLGIARRPSFTGGPGKFVIIIDSLGARRLTSWVADTTPGATGPQTLTHTFNFGDRDTGTKGFYLGFPPGKGVVNLLSIRMVPKS